MAFGGLLEVVAEVLAELVGAHVQRPNCRGSGASRARTGDLLHAMQALSQLSYSPWKFEIYRKIETGSLTIFRRLQPQVNAPAASHKLAGEKVAAVQFVAVDRYEVYLVLAVITPLIAGWRTPRTRQVHTQHGAPVAEVAPLALDSNEPTADLERQIVTRVVHDWTEDWNIEFRRCCRNLGLGYRTLLVRR
jgi:hypothetical protein